MKSTLYHVLLRVINVSFWNDDSMASIQKIMYTLYMLQHMCWSLIKIWGIKLLHNTKVLCKYYVVQNGWRVNAAQLHLFMKHIYVIISFYTHWLLECNTGLIIKFCNTLCYTFQLSSYCVILILIVPLKYQIMLIFHQDGVSQWTESN